MEGEDVSGKESPKIRAYKFAFMATVCLIVSVLIYRLGPLPQDPLYHNFADQRTLFGVPNFWNVVSNAGFFFVGLYGLRWLARLFALSMAFFAVVVAVIYTAPVGNSGPFEKKTEKLAYWMLLQGVVLVSFGSGYYHWRPTTGTLFWDRLPMTIAFMSLTSSLWAEKVSLYWGRMFLFPMIIIGMVSVFWWSFTELSPDHVGDLRFYASVQLAPILISPFIFTMFRGRYSHASYYAGAVFTYVVAKVAEVLDHQLYRWSFELMSGHCAKHLISAVGIWIAVEMIKKRTSLKAKAV